MSTIQTSTPSGALEIRDSAGNWTAVQSGALKGTSSLTPPSFQDTNGVEIGTLCRAWVRMNSGTSPSVAAGFNVTSITYLSTGNWRIAFTNPMPTANYVCFATFDGNYNITSGLATGNTTTASISCKTGSGAGYNPTQIYVGFFC